jgi:chaperonin GroES
MAKAARIKPLADRVVVKRLEAEEKTAGGIVLPDSAKEKPKQGEVIAVGPGALDDEGKRTPPQVKVGDRILFTSYAGNEVTLADEEYLILREEDILGILK